MPQIASTLPTIGEPNATEDIDVRNFLSDVKNLVNGGLDTENLDPTGAAITDEQLASPNNGVYKTVIRGASNGLGGFGAVGNWIIAGSGTAVFDGTTASGVSPLIWRFYENDYVVSGHTTKFRIMLELMCGTGSPNTSTVRGGLWPIAIDGSANLDLGAVVTGSTTAAIAGTALQITTSSSSDFAASALTSGAAYAIGFAIATATLPQSYSVNVVLQMRHN